jgi:hypothetical protein
MKILLISFITLSLLTFAGHGYSKPRIIKGTVYGKNGKEARGVIVTADKSGNSYYTSFDGAYEIKAKSNSKWLKFKFPDEEVKFSIEGIERDVIDFKFPAQTQKSDKGIPPEEVKKSKR